MFGFFPINTWEGLRKTNCMWDIFCPPTVEDTEYLEAQEGLSESEVIVFSQQFQASDK